LPRVAELQHPTLDFSLIFPFFPLPISPPPVLSAGASLPADQGLSQTCGTVNPLLPIFFRPLPLCSPPFSLRIQLPVNLPFCPRQGGGCFSAFCVFPTSPRPTPEHFQTGVAPFLSMGWSALPLVTATYGLPFPFFRFLRPLPSVLSPFFSYDYLLPCGSPPPIFARLFFFFFLPSSVLSMRFAPPPRMTNDAGTCCWFNVP